MAVMSALAAVASLPASAQSTAQTTAQTTAPTTAPGTAFDTTSAVAVIVKVPTPWYAPRALVLSRMRDTQPQYEALPGLAFKAFSLAQPGGQFGGIYLWRDLASARAWFSPAWFERVQKERGTPGDVRFYEVPVAMDNTPGGTANDPSSTTISTLVTVPTPPGVSRQRLIAGFQASVPMHKAAAGLLRKYFIITDDGKFGGIYLWRDTESAQQWFNAEWKDRALKAYGAPATIEWFDTPILLNTKLAENRVTVSGL